MGLWRRTVFQNLVEMLQMVHDDVSVLLQDRQCDEQVETAGVVICPQRFPQSKNVPPFKFALVPYQKHTEKEEEIRAVGGLEVKVELRIHELD